MMNDKIRIRDYLLMAILMFASLSPWAFASDYGQPILIGSLLVTITMLSKRTIDCLVRDLRFFLIILAFTISIISVSQIFSFWSIFSFGIVVRLILGILIFAEIGSVFPAVLYRSVAVASVTSLIFYATQFAYDPQSFPGLEVPGAPHRSWSSLVVHTYLSSAGDRNAGFTWEPGSFQALINLTIFIVPTRVLLARGNRARSAYLIVALISTLSSTGYLVFFVICALKMMLEFKLNLRTSATIVALVISSAGLFVAVPFLGDKITSQIEAIDESRGYSSNRFQTMRFDWHYIEKHPLVGNGLNEATRYADHRELFGRNLGHGNGLSDFIASMGLISVAAYILSILCTRRLGRFRWRMAFLLIITLELFAERFMLTPLFLGLPFLTRDIKKPPQRATSDIGRFATIRSVKYPR